MPLGINVGALLAYLVRIAYLGLRAFLSLLWLLLGSVRRAILRNLLFKPMPTEQLSLPLLAARLADLPYQVETAEQVRQDPLMADIFAAVSEDSKYLEAVDAKRSGVTKAELKKLPSENGARAYMSVWDHLSLLDDKEDSILVFNMNRIVVPQSCQRKVLETLHLPWQWWVERTT